MKLHVLASGSSGNAYCLETATDLIFIDIGVSLTAVRRLLTGIDDTDSKKISLLLTHEHSDHSSGLIPFSRKYAPDIYTNPATADWVADAGVDTAAIHPLKKGAYYELSGFALTAFPVPHDVPTAGFLLMTDYGNIGLATDCGLITDVQLRGLEAADCIILEANYDKQMLKAGSYPAYLKKRIAGSQGHLSNDDMMAALVALSGNLKSCFFAHISEENNDYAILEQLAEISARQYGVNCNVLRQHQALSFDLSAIAQPLNI